MGMVPHATKQDFNEALKGFHYPISRAAILNMGRDKGGIDREVARVLSVLPDRRYNSEADVIEAIRAIYLGNGVEEDDLPV
jgi:hypothetical protein